MSEDQLTTLFGDVTVVQAVLWIMAACVFVFLVWKLWPVVRKFVDTVDALGDLPEKLQLLERIDHELHPNSGLSLRDSMDRTEKAVVEIQEQVTEHIEWSLAQVASGEQQTQAIEDRFDAIETTLNPGKDS